MESELFYKSIGKVRLLSSQGSILVTKSIQSSVQAWSKEEGISETVEKSYPDKMIFNLFLITKINEGVKEFLIALETQLNKEFFLLKLDVEQSSEFLNHALSGFDLGLNNNILAINPVLQLEFI